MASITVFPVEILHMIVTEFGLETWDIAALAATCRLFYSLVNGNHILYRKVDLRWGPGIPKFLSKIRLNPDLAKLTTSITFDQRSPSGITLTEIERSANASTTSLITSVLQQLRPLHNRYIWLPDWPTEPITAAFLLALYLLPKVTSLEITLGSPGESMLLDTMLSWGRSSGIFSQPPPHFLLSIRRFAIRLSIRRYDIPGELLLAILQRCPRIEDLSIAGSEMWRLIGEYWPIYTESQWWAPSMSNLKILRVERGMWTSKALLKFLKLVPHLEQLSYTNSYQYGMISEKMYPREVGAALLSARGTLKSVQLNVRSGSIEGWVGDLSTMSALRRLEVPMAFLCQTDFKKLQEMFPPGLVQLAVHCEPRYMELVGRAIPGVFKKLKNHLRQFLLVPILSCRQIDSAVGEYAESLDSPFENNLKKALIDNADDNKFATWEASIQDVMIDTLSTAGQVLTEELFDDEEFESAKALVRDAMITTLSQAAKDTGIEFFHAEEWPTNVILL